MKTLLPGLIVLISMPSFASSIEESSYCRERGLEKLELFRLQIEELKINTDVSRELFVYFVDALIRAQTNYDYLCMGIRISRGPELSAEEKKLQLIKDGVANGDIDPELVDLFLNQIQ